MVQRDKRPRTSEFPLQIPARVLPMATLAIQSVTFMAAMERLLKKRREVKRTMMAMEPITSGCRIEALTKKSATWMVSGPATTRVPLLPLVPEDMFDRCLVW